MTKPLPFEKSIAELDKIVKQLEKGELTLEESLKQYEKAMQLAWSCQKILTEAEQKVELLSESMNQSFMEEKIEDQDS